MKRSLLFLLMCGSFLWSQAQNSAQIWTNKQVDQIAVSSQQTVQTFATNYRLVELDRDQLAPMMLSNSKSSKKITVPLADGEQVELTIQLDQIMAPGLASRYPEIKTYKIIPDGKNVYGGRLGWTLQGFHATIRTDKGVIYIDPYILEDDRYYVVYNVNDNINTSDWGSFTCGTMDNLNGDILDPEELFPSQEVLDSQEKNLTGAPVMLRTYRFAASCTGEFSFFYRGADNMPSVAESLSGIVAIVNRVNEVFAHEISVRLELIESNDQVIFLTPGDDPFDNSATDLLMNTNQTVLDLNVGNNAYDLGHVFSTGPSVGGGIARLESACDDDAKGRGSSTRASPTGDPFVINILCHEMGHQLGATHVTSGCQNVNPPTAVEPGGGTTIMSYAGICANGYNLQQNADDYYSATSLEQIIDYTRNGNGSTCGTVESFNNSIPDVTLSYEDGFYIPISTPFELTGTAVDMEGDDMTYTWEGRDFELSIVYDDDNGVYGPQPGSPVGNSPLFRSIYPSDSPTRVFPKMSRVISNTSNVDEVLPTYSRNLSFRLTARDNHISSGGAGWADVAFHATEEAGPFLVMSPNEGTETWNVGNYTEVTWDVANTDASPVNCQRVNIRLSTDGGMTYPIMLLENTPNTGSAFVTVPDAISTTARIRVDAAASVFFDISNANFSIEAATTPGYTLGNTPLYQEVCTPDLAEVSFETATVLDFTGTVDLEITSTLPVGVTASFNSSSIQAGENSALSLDFSDSNFDGLLDIEVRAISSADDTTYRSFTVEVYNNNYDAMTLTEPVDGLSGVVLSEDFSWAAVPNASTYDIQIAYGPDFDTNLFEEATDLEGTSYTPDGLFEGNSLLYWRVRGINECGPGPWTLPFTFHTEIISCNEFNSQDTPINIPGTGPLPTVVSTINVSLNGAISDVNVCAVDVIYSPVQNFKITLISPAGTSVVLYNSTCFSTDRIFAGFDDEAPEGLVCPPTNGIVYQPFGSLSDFIGENSEGQWQLEVKVNETGNGSAGSVGDWCIEFCTTSNAIAPTVLTNETLFVPPLMSNPIGEDLLSMDDADQNPLELEYTVVTLPEHGKLYSFFGELAVGSTFRQASINANNIRYENENGDATEDAFTFIVQDGTGGFLPVQQFNIVIDENATVGTNDLIAAEKFRLFPNPASENVTLEWGEITKDQLPLKVYNLQGQLISQQTLAEGLIQWKMDVSDLPTGVYVVQVGLHSERLIIH